MKSAELPADFLSLRQAQIQIEKFESAAVWTAISVQHENSLVNLLITAPKSRPPPTLTCICIRGSVGGGTKDTAELYY